MNIMNFFWNSKKMANKGIYRLFLHYKTCYKMLHLRVKSISVLVSFNKSIKKGKVTV